MIRSFSSLLHIFRVVMGPPRKGAGVGRSRRFRLPRNLPQTPTRIAAGIYRGTRQPFSLRSLIRNNLLDRLHLVLFPIVAGTGLRLFEGEFVSQKMKVVDLIRNRNGVLAITYRPKGHM